MQRKSAKRIKNDLHTGYYAGEREDYMMNGINMTEKGLIKENVPVKVALDHGWSSIKGEHIFMETSVVPVDYTPLTNHGLLEYKGQKYIIGQGRLGKQATKTENDNYFLLTLVGIAKELQCQGNEQAEQWNYMQVCRLLYLVQREKNFAIISGIRKEYHSLLRVFVIPFLWTR